MTLAVFGSNQPNSPSDARALRQALTSSEAFVLIQKEIIQHKAAPPLLNKRFSMSGIMHPLSGLSSVLYWKNTAQLQKRSFWIFAFLFFFSSFSLFLAFTIILFDISLSIALYIFHVILMGQHCLDIVDFPISALIKMVASLLESVIHTNDRIPCNSITVFHSRAVPNIKIDAYLARIQKFTPYNNDALLCILVYFDRISKLQPKFVLNSLNIHRLLIARYLVFVFCVKQLFPEPWLTHLFVVL